MQTTSAPSKPGSAAKLVPTLHSNASAHNKPIPNGLPPLATNAVRTTQPPITAVFGAKAPTKVLSETAKNLNGLSKPQPP